MALRQIIDGNHYTKDCVENIPQLCKHKLFDGDAYAILRRNTAGLPSNIFAGDAINTSLSMTGTLLACRRSTRTSITLCQELVQREYDVRS